MYGRCKPGRCNCVMAGTSVSMASCLHSGRVRSSDRLHQGKVVIHQRRGAGDGAAPELGVGGDGVVGILAVGQRGHEDLHRLALAPPGQLGGVRRLGAGRCSAARPARTAAFCPAGSASSASTRRGARRANACSCYSVMAVPSVATTLAKPSWCARRASI